MFVFVSLENFPSSDLLAETSTGLEASLSNSNSCRYLEGNTQNTLFGQPVCGQVQKGRRKKLFCKAVLKPAVQNRKCSHGVCKSRQANKEVWQRSDNV